MVPKPVKRICSVVLKEKDFKDLVKKQTILPFSGVLVLWWRKPSRVT